MKLKKFLSASIALSITASMAVMPMSAKAEDEMNVYYSQDFEAVTDFKAWEAENNLPSMATPFRTWGDRDVTELEESDGNTYIWSKSLSILPLAQTAKTGKYVFEYDFQPESYTAPATNWEAGVVQMKVGSTYNTNQDWHAILLSSSAGKSLTDGEYPVDTVTVFGKAMTICGSGWINAKILYDCEAMKITITVTDEEGNSITASENMASIGEAYEGMPEFAMSGLLNDLGFGGRMDNIKIYDYVEPKQPDTGLEDGVYYLENFDSTTKEEWDAKYNSDKRIDYQVTYAWGNTFTTLEDGNNVLHKTNGDAYWFDVTPQTGIYELKFDIRPAIKTAAANTTVTNLDIAGSWMQSSNISFITDANGDVNKMKFKVGSTDKTITIDPEKWVTVKVVRNFETNVNIVTASYEGQTLEGQEETTLIKSSFSYDKNTTPVPGVYLDNISVMDYVEPTPEEDGVYYQEDFDSITAEDWTAEQKSTDEVAGKTTYAYNVNHITEADGNNALKIDGTSDIYLFSSTPKTSKYTAKFDLKPLQTTGPASSTVFRADVVARWIEGVNLSLVTDAEGNVNKLQVYDKELAIDPTKWITIEIVRDFTASPNPVTVIATQGEKSVKGTEEADAGYYKSSMDLNKVSTDDFAGVLIDNVSVKDFSESEAPKLSADDIKIYADGVEQKATKVSSFTDKIEIDFGQKMKVADMSEDCIWVEDEDGEKVSTAKYTYSDGVLTIKFPYGLTSGKKFTVKLTNVRNNGGVMMADIEKSFITAGGVFAELVNITQNGNAVNALADFAQGAAMVNISYSNTEDTTPEIHIIAAYYKEGALTDVDFIKWQTSDDLPLINYGFNYTVPANDGAYDEVQFMVWDGFGTLNPLSAPITLK